MLPAVHLIASGVGSSDFKVAAAGLNASVSEISGARFKVLWGTGMLLADKIRMRVFPFIVPRDFKHKHSSCQREKEHCHKAQLTKP